MKLRIIFLKRRSFIILCISLLTILSVFFVKNFNSSTTLSVFNIMETHKLLKKDLTGDGEKDILYINTENNKYYIQISTEEKSLNLAPSKKLNTLGAYYPHWPMRLSLVDLSRDHIPEIFIQSSKNGNPIQHVYLWSENDFQDIFCSNNNLLGFTDTHSNKTPRMVSGKIANGKMILQHYLLLQNKLKSFRESVEEDFMGKEVINTMIHWLENYSTTAQAPKSLLLQLNKQHYISLKPFLNENMKYDLQDAFFMDNGYDKNGTIAEVTWTLNFCGVSKEATTEKKNDVLQVVLKNTASYPNAPCYRIKSIVHKPSSQ